MSLEWVAAFFRDADMVEIDKLAAWFADDIELRFANNPAIRDKATAVQVMSQFYDSISGMSHSVETLIGDGEAAAQQAIVTYTRKDGGVVPLPVSSYLRRNAAGKLDRLWIYIDIAPLWADAA
ncbi:DUF4783 domain-containing protein [Sphingomonas histidinilytica]|uniref:SnoaL-like domain-containing protein n=1 Tax=Rhizorhabdus histidinilytica TaxID=439228 RepID=A0A1T5G5A4_9SPHN|nr:nuclear transport factor 2 family protein [Rhizorhabdus histidinilytica]MBO9375406.1 DUF4783 domain-containing protein [Rhizorhabdus histidinilytica]SKC03625.1 SnoaL-like domain-containing protein [Rhizorhabdus histidinilytica]